MLFRVVVATGMIALVSPLFALDGENGIHDPSTIVQCDGKFYTYATGRGLPISVSDDGWTWRRAGSAIGGPGPAGTCDWEETTRGLQM